MYIKSGYPLQLVQTAHKKTNDKWIERQEFVTEDLFIMFWRKLTSKGSFPDYFHTHSTCSPVNRVKEFSQYDAGWLHVFESNNNGDIMKATWDDLNIPARINTLAAACLPIILKDNTGHVVAMQECVKKFETGIFFKDYLNLSKLLSNKELLYRMTNNMRNNRFNFCFDEHVEMLINFFRDVINMKKNRRK